MSKQNPSEKLKLIDGVIQNSRSHFHWFENTYLRFRVKFIIQCSPYKVKYIFKFLLNSALDRLILAIFLMSISISKLGV